MQQLSLHGDPDLCLCINGRFVGMELKIDGEKLRPLQQYKLEEIRKAGGVAIHAHPSVWEEIKRQLENLAKGKRYDQDNLRKISSK